MQMKMNSSSSMDSMLALDIIHVANGEEVCTLWHSVVNLLYFSKKKVLAVVLSYTHMDWTSDKNPNLPVISTGIFATRTIVQVYKGATERKYRMLEIKGFWPFLLNFDNATQWHKVNDLDFCFVSK